MEPPAGLFQREAWIVPNRPRRLDAVKSALFVRFGKPAQRPGAFAVFPLITNVNLAVLQIGRSVGFAPLYRPRPVSVAVGFIGCDPELADGSAEGVSALAASRAISRQVRSSI